MLDKVFGEFLSGLAKALLELIDFNNLLQLIFFAENELLKITGLDFGKLFDFFQDVGIGFIGIKFLLKVLNVYILEVDGDPETPFVYYVIRFGKALMLALTFRHLYKFVIEKFIKFIEKTEIKVFEAFTSKGMGEISVLIDTIVTTLSTLKIILIFVWALAALYLWFMFLQKGVETLILRIGVSWAASGVINSDDGVWKPYLNKFFQNAITVLVQYILMVLSLRLMLDITNILYSFAFLFMAIRTPRFLQEFMIVTSTGGGLSNRIYYGAQMMRSAVRFLTSKGGVKN